MTSSNKSLVIPVNHEIQQQQHHQLQPKELNEGEKVRAKDDFQKWFYPNNNNSNTIANTNTNENAIKMSKKDSRVNNASSDKGDNRGDKGIATNGTGETSAQPGMYFKTFLPKDPNYASKKLTVLY
jgi:hypothetical protein